MENDCYRHLLTPWTNLLSAACPPTRGRALGERPDSHLKQLVPILVTQHASPGPKADLVSPTSVGECANQEPPWYQVGMRYLDLETLS